MRFFIYLLIIFSFTESFFLNLNLGGISFNFKYSQLTIFVALGFVLIDKIANKKHTLKYNTFDLLIILYFISNIIPSIIIAKSILAVKSSFVILTYILAYFITKYLITFYSNGLKTIIFANKINTLSILFGLACFMYSYSTGNSSIGVSLGHLSNGIPSIRSLSFEPNLFAIITATFFVINISVLKKRNYGYILLLIQAVAILLAFTRSVYAALMICFLILMVYAPANIKSKYLKWSALIVFCVVAFLFLNPSSHITDSLIKRTSNITNTNTGSALARLAAFEQGLSDFQRHPIIGSGTMTADTKVYNEYTKEYNDLNGSPGWLTGLWIQALHDSGLLGLLVVIILFMHIIYKNFKAYKLCERNILKRYYLGFMLSNILVLVTTNVSSIMWSSFIYIFWAINESFLNFKIIKR